MVTVWIVFCSVVPVFVEDLKPPKRDFRIANLMRDAHVKGRQTYRSLDQLLISGRSRPEERKKFAELYTKLRDLTPPQGTADSWRFDIDRILTIVREADEAQDEEAAVKAGVKLLYATNCIACHEKYRYAPKPGADEVAPQSLAVGRKVLAAGGKEWSAPESLKDRGYAQWGRRLLVWPEKIEYYRSQESGKHTVASVRFNWVLLPGASTPDGSPQTFYYHYYQKGTNSVGFQFTSPHGSPPAREGSFSVGFDVPREGTEIAFVMLTNSTVPVPLGNFVVFKFPPQK